VDNWVARIDSDLWGVVLSLSRKGVQFKGD